MRRLIVNIAQILSNQIPDLHIFNSIFLNLSFILRFKAPIGKFKFEFFPHYIITIKLDIIFILDFIARFQNGEIIFEIFGSSKPLHLMAILTFMSLVFKFFMLIMSDIALLSAHRTMLFTSDVFLS